MKSTRTLAVVTALNLGLMHATPAFAWHLDAVGGSYMMLIYLNLIIIVFLGFYAMTIQENKKPVRSREDHFKGRIYSNQIHGQPAAQGYATCMEHMIGVTFVEVPRLRNSREKDDQISTGIMPIVWQEKSVQPKPHQKDVDARWKDVDACWIKKRRESNYYSGSLSQGNNTSSLSGQ